MSSQSVISIHKALPIDLHKKGLVGVDEAGRGPLAGPVVASAVILNPYLSHQGLIDSKKLSAKQRQSWSQWIKANALDWSIEFVAPYEIDQFNILQASIIAMQRAVGQLDESAIEHILVDGHHVPSFNHPCMAVVKGDQRVQAISGASILAKVARDDYMITMDEQFPHYQFGQHKGYPTARHLEALAQYGPCDIHRKSFAPVRQWLVTYE